MIQFPKDRNVLVIEHPANTDRNWIAQQHERIKECPFYPSCSSGTSKINGGKWYFVISWKSDHDKVNGVTTEDFTSVLADAKDHGGREVGSEPRDLHFHYGMIIRGGI